MSCSSKLNKAKEDLDRLNQTFLSLINVKNKKLNELNKENESLKKSELKSDEQIVKKEYLNSLVFK